MSVINKKIALSFCLTMLLTSTCFAEQNLKDIFSNLKKVVESAQNGQSESNKKPPEPSSIETPNTVDTSDSATPSIKSKSIFDKPAEAPAPQPRSKLEIADEECHMGIAFIKLLKSKEQRISELLTEDEIRLLSDPKQNNIDYKNNPKLADHVTTIADELSKYPEWQYWKIHTGNIDYKFRNMQTKVLSTMADQYAKEHRTFPTEACFESLGLAHEDSRNIKNGDITAYKEQEKSKNHYIASLLTFKNNIVESTVLIAKAANSSAQDKEINDAKALADDKTKRWNECYAKNKAITDLANASFHVVDLRNTISNLKNQIADIEKYPSNYTQKDYDGARRFYDQFVSEMPATWKKYKQLGGKANTVESTIYVASPCDAIKSSLTVN